MKKSPNLPELADLPAQRILIVDDNFAIHEDFRRILSADEKQDSFDAAAASFFGSDAPEPTGESFELSFASQGQEALKKVQEACREAKRFSVVFMDIRMPPGWDGVETTRRLWEEDPDLQVVICTAYSDYSWDEIVSDLGQTDKLMILKKPFDIIEVKQAAHALAGKWSLLQDSRRHAMFLEQTMDQSPSMILWITEDGSFSYANHATCQQLGYELDSILKLRADDVFPLWKDEAWHAVWEKICTQHNLIEETRIVTCSRQEIPVEIIATSLDFDKRRIISVSAQDISARIRSIKELAAARDAALESVRMKSQFLANMSHEIRTPMNGVLGMAEILAKTRLDDTQRSYVEIITRSGSSLLSIINDILDSAKVESGKFEFQTVDFDLSSVVRDALHTLEPVAQKKNLSLKSDIDTSVTPYLRGDPGKLGQVLVNLLGNAVKFTSAGEVQLSVSTMSETDTRTQLHFSVRDSGIGIAPDILDRIFQPFTQADGTDTRRYGGTGLGLTISTQIVQALGGEITVKSDPGVGSDFSFHLDFEKQANGLQASEVPAPPEEPVNSPVATSSQDCLSNPPRILLVEDNDVNRFVTRRQLQQIGFQADEVENGKEALAALENTPYDIVLMDCQMPVMDGFQATMEIRRLYSHPIRIVALTANAMQEDRERCLAAGMDDYLSKPFSTGHLAKVLGIGLPAQQQASDTTASIISEQQPAQATDEVEPVDRARFYETIDGNAEMHQLVSQGYLNQADDILSEMLASIKKEDFDQMRKLAHKLGGSSSTCGMIAIVPVLREIEHLKEPDLSKSADLHADAVLNLRRIRNFLKILKI